MTENINIRFNGESNFSQVDASIKKLRGEFALLQRDAISAAQAGNGNTSGYRAMSDGLKGVRENFRVSTAAAGEFQIIQQKLIPQSTAFGEAIKQQKVGMMDLIRQRKLMSVVLKEQIALQNASSLAWSVDRSGKISSDLIIPKNLPANLIGARQQIGMWNAALASVSQNTINWGKNTQWAGRQLMTGLSLPLGLLAAAAGKFAYDYDKALTNVVKVYGDANSALQESQSSIRDSAMSTVKAASAIYGQSGKDTLEIMAALAAAGKQGNELQQATMMTSRASILGELEWQDAVKATIALQSVYSHSAQQIGDDFNYINAMENQTVLSSKDFVTAIPKVAGVMNALGADLKDVGTLLTAFKASGIDAAEGANALKSINFRLVGTYGKGLDTFYKATGQSLKKIIAETNGETIPSLMRFGAAIKDLSAPQKIAVTRDVFGIYQGSKALLMLEQLTNGSDQLARALAVGENSVAQNAAIAQQELDRLNAQPFTIMKKAAQSLQLVLVDIGSKILPYVATFFTKISEIAKSFANMNPAIKLIVLLGMAAVGLAGPIIMLVGLFANLIGNVGRMGTALIDLYTRFTITDAAQRAQVLQGRLAAQTWDLQTAAVNKQVIALETVAKIMRKRAIQTDFSMPGSPMIGPKTLEQTAKQSIVRNTVIPLKSVDLQNLPSNISMAKNTQLQMRLENGRKVFIKESEVLRIQNEQLLSIEAQNVERQKTEKTLAHIRLLTEDIKRSDAIDENIIRSKAAAENQRVAGIASKGSGALMAAGMVGTMVTDSNGLMGTLANIALMAGMLGSMFQGAATKIVSIFKAMFAFIWSGFVNVFGVQLVGLLGKAKIAMMAFAAANKAAIAGALVVVAALYMAWDRVRDNTEKARQSVEDYNNFSKDVANQLGFSYQETVVGIPGGNKSGAAQAQDAATKFASEHEAAAAAFSAKKGTDIGQIWGAAVAQGASVKIHGGTTEAATKATRIALSLMGQSFTDSEFEAKLKVLVDFEDITSTTNALNKNVGAASKEAMGQAKVGWEKAWSDAMQFNWSPQANTMTDAGLESIKKAYKDAIDNAMAQKPEDQAAIFDTLFNTMQAPIAAAYTKALKMDPNKLKELGIQNVKDFGTYMNADLGPGGTETKAGILSSLGFNTDEIKNIGLANDEVKVFVDLLRQIPGVTIPKEFVDLNSIRDSIASTVGARKSVLSLADATKQYESAQKTWKTSAGKPMNDEQQLAALNSARVAAGLQTTLYVLDGFGPASTLFVQSVKTMEEALLNLSLSPAITPEIVQSSWKNVITGTITDISSAASASLEAEGAAAVDATKARGDAALKGIEDRGKAQDEAAKRADEKQKDRTDKSKKALDAAQKVRRKAMEAGYEAQIKAIDKAINAEKAQEDIRQKIFEAEKTRISRLAEMYNKNIDLNMAINSGNMDEAAKIQNDMIATQQGWNVGDAADSSKTVSEKKIAGLETEKEKINAVKDIRLAALAITEAAEDEALAKKIKREDTVLQKKQESNKRSLELDKERQQAMNKTAEEGAARNVAIAKAKFETELAVLKAFVPRNEAEMNTQIAQIQDLYKKYGTNVLTPQGENWGSLVARSLKDNVAKEAGALKTVVAWSTVGMDIANGMIQGAFGMNPAQFAKWLGGGIAPPNSLYGTTPKGKMLDYAEKHPDRLAYGGPVWGRGTATSDSIRAWLSNGEYVINAKQTAKHRPILEAINNGLPAFAAGGSVGMGMAGVSGSLVGGAIRVLLEKTIGALAARGPLGTGRIDPSKRKASQYNEGAPSPGIGGASITGASRDRLRQFGHILQTLGFNVGENVAFGKVYPVHAENSWHYRDGAIDVNYDGHGQQFENDRINSILGMARQTGLRTIWQYPGHYNHAHFDIGSGADMGNFAGARHAAGGLVMPQLKTGGYTLNDGYARLHKAETVLTAPLSKQLNDGIDRLANGPVTSYTIKADFNGATFASDVDVERAFQNLMDKAERRNGSNRKIGSN